MKELFEGWIARDKNNTLKIRGGKPKRNARIGTFGKGYALILPVNLFPLQRWEDEPRKVKITIETVD